MDTFHQAQVGMNLTSLNLSATQMQAILNTTFLYHLTFANSFSRLLRVKAQALESILSISGICGHLPHLLCRQVVFLHITLPGSFPASHIQQAHHVFAQLCGLVVGWLIVGVLSLLVTLLSDESWLS